MVYTVEILINSTTLGLMYLKIFPYQTEAYLLQFCVFVADAEIS